MQAPRGDESLAPGLAAEHIERIKANLHVIARASDKLPPVITYRRGWAAQLELWIKRRLKKLTRWYTWEQVNFNSAVHNALGEACAALAAQAQHLAELQDRLDASCPPPGTASQSQIASRSEGAARGRHG